MNFKKLSRIADSILSDEQLKKFYQVAPGAGRWSEEEWDKVAYPYSRSQETNREEASRAYMSIATLRAELSTKYDCTEITLSANKFPTFQVSGAGLPFPIEVAFGNYGLEVDDHKYKPTVTQEQFISLCELYKTVRDITESNGIQISSASAIVYLTSEDVLVHISATHDISVDAFVGKRTIEKKGIPLEDAPEILNIVENLKGNLRSKSRRSGKGINVSDWMGKLLTQLEALPGFNSSGLSDYEEFEGEVAKNPSDLENMLDSGYLWFVIGSEDDVEETEYEDYDGWTTTIDGIKVEADFNDSNFGETRYDLSIIY